MPCWGGVRTEVRTELHVEAGVSGSVEFQERPEGKRLIEMLALGDMIIFPKLDRTFSNTRNALNVLHEWFLEIWSRGRQTPFV